MSRSITPNTSQVIRRLIRNLWRHEPELFIEFTLHAGKAEQVSVAQERFLKLAENPGFEPFFALLSRDANKLTSPCRWLIFGPKLVPDSQQPPSLLQLRRLVNLVSREQPELAGFLHDLLTTSVLPYIAASEAPWHLRLKHTAFQCRRTAASHALRLGNFLAQSFQIPTRFMGSESSVEAIL